MSTWVNFLEILYPVGSVYISAVDRSPAESIGGTWEKIEGKFLLSSGDDYPVATSGGTAEHAHNVAICYYTNYGVVGGDDNTAIRMWNYDTLSWVGSTDLGKENVYRNTGINDGRALKSTDKRQSIGRSSSTSSFPPYFVVCCWRRVQ